MKAEIVTIGTELLLGQIVDTNAAYLAQQLAAIGVDLFFKTTVGDNIPRIAGILQQASQRSDLIITSGGLGPTVDDMTREAIALATGRGLEFMPAAWDEISAMFARWGRRPDENNRRQALLPAGSLKVTNPVGTAPAFILETGACTIISLPGVPRELKHLMEFAVIPYLRQRLGDQAPIIKSRVLRTCSIGESNVDTLIGDLETLTNPTVGLLAHPAQTDIRITAKATSAAEADGMIAPLETEIRQRLGVYIYGVDDESLEEVTARLLLQHNYTLALVETNTAGAVAAWLRATPFAAALHSALVAADLPHLQSALPALTADDAWPSAALALAAAQAMQAASGADFTLAIIGTMQGHETMYSDERGESFIALLHPEGLLTRRFPLGGAGEVTQRWIGNRALDLLRRVILGLATESGG
ncbi:MAG: CinA family nicotinamide mononucleotide deamidase-related protein [Anaerolineae bacterium]